MRGRALMVPLGIAVPGLLACAAVGWALDRAAGWELGRRGALGWAARVLAGVALLASLALHPIALAMLAALAWLERRHAAAVARDEARRAPERRDAEPGTREERERRTRSPLAMASAGGTLAVLGAAVAIAALRPAVPLYWDEHVWLAKVHLASTAPLALRAASLDPSADILPRGYPILASLAESLFALGRADLGSLVAGATALVLLSVAVALAAIPERRRVAWALALATVPLAWVHLRSAHLDLVVGLLALSVAASLLRVRDGERALPLAMASAFFLAGTKDEGVAHALAIAAAHAISSRDRGRALGEGALVAAAALVAALGWRVLLAVHDVVPRDHALDAAGLASAGAIVRELVRASSDVTSWGATWPIVLGAVIAAVAVRADRARGLALALLLSLVALTAGLLLGSERLRAFALAGTLANRLLIQLVPLGALVVVETLCAITPADDRLAHSGRFRPRAKRALPSAPSGASTPADSGALRGCSARRGSHVEST